MACLHPCTKFKCPRSETKFYSLNLELYRLGFYELIFEMVHNMSGLGSHYGH